MSSPTRDWVTLVRSPRLPAGPPTRELEVVARGEGRAELVKAGPERLGSRVAGPVLRDDDDLAGGAAAQQVDREAGGGALRWLGAGDGREHEVAGAEDPGRLALSVSRALVDGIWPRALITAACMVPRPAVSCPAGPTPPVSPEASWPVPLVSWPSPVCSAPGAGGELAQPAGELAAAA